MNIETIIIEAEKSFDTALKTFIKGCEKIILDNAKKAGPDGEKFYMSKLSITSGKKYVKIISEPLSGGGKSVWAFVNKTNGDILKPATWSAPAKHARGNIFDKDNGLSGITAYGPNYLK